MLHKVLMGRAHSCSPTFPMKLGNSLLHQENQTLMAALIAFISMEEKNLAWSQMWFFQTSRGSAFRAALQGCERITHISACYEKTIHMTGFPNDIPLLYLMIPFSLSHRIALPLFYHPVYLIIGEDKWLMLIY